jgi:hypothetical protein
LILRPRYRGSPSTSPEDSGNHREHYGGPIIHQHRTPQLLPPPPEPFWGSTSFLFFVPVGSWAHIPLPNFRFALFILKQALSLQICIPLAVNPWVYYPLVIFAVLSLPVQNAKFQVMSLVIHLLMMTLSVRMSAMCIWSVPSPMF